MAAKTGSIGIQGESMGRPRKINGSVERMRCARCACTFAHFTFDGDADYVTEGLLSASACNDEEVLVIEASPKEWADASVGEFDLLSLRIEAETGRTDFRVLRLVRYERASPPEKKTRFIDFRKTHKHPVPFYSCPCCENGEARRVQDMTPDQFVKAGGRIIRIGQLRYE